MQGSQSAVELAGQTRKLHSQTRDKNPELFDSCTGSLSLLEQSSLLVDRDGTGISSAVVCMQRFRHAVDLASQSKKEILTNAGLKLTARAKQPQ